MQTLILNHYPPVIKQIKEMQQIAKAEDIEFSKLNISINEVIQNMFLFTANEVGVQRFEHLFGITPKASQSIEERKTMLLLWANRRKMSLSELHTMLLDCLQEVQFATDINKLKLEITTNVEANVEILRSMIEDILPLNVYFILGYHDNYCVSIQRAISIMFTTTFYPRFNLPELLLDGIWILDGSQELNGYNGGERMDLYPVGMEFRTEVLANPKKQIQIHLLVHTEQLIRSREMMEVMASAGCMPASAQTMETRAEAAGKLKEETKVAFASEAKEQADCGQAVTIRVSAECEEVIKESVVIQLAAEVRVRTGDIFVENMNVLDDKWELDGNRELNGGDYILE